MNTTKEQKLKALQKQLEDIQKEMEKLQKPEDFYIVVKSHKERNWYKTGQVYKVSSGAKGSPDGEYYPLVSNSYLGIGIDDVVVIDDKDAEYLLSADNVIETRK